MFLPARPLLSVAAVCAAAAVMAVCGFVMAWQRFFADKDYLADE